MRLRQDQKLKLKLALTPQMKQSLSLLQMPIIELRTYLEQEVEENPLLEDELSLGKTSLEELQQTDTYDNILYYSQGEDSEDSIRKYTYRQTLITAKPTLQEVLLRQLRMIPLSDIDTKIGEEIIGNIDDNGYLSCSLDEVGDALKNKLFLSLEHSRIEKILRLIQKFEPIGVGARNLRECLLIQLKFLRRENSLTYKIVERFLPEVAAKKVRVIARKLKVSPSRVRRAIEEIFHLEPKPGRMFFPTQYSTITSPSHPDVIIKKSQDTYEVIINQQDIPRFRINKKYQELLSSSDVSEETKEYIRSKLKRIQNIQRALTLREETIRRVSESILEKQKDFFAQGDISLLKPMTMKEIAQIIGRNESTVSRVVNSKYVETPYGTFRMSFFFHRPLNNSTTHSISREMIKSHIHNLIEEENPHTPLTDEEIAKLLKERGIKIARRTVTKYREELKIPPAHKRRKQK